MDDDRIDKSIPRTSAVILRCTRKGCKAVFSTKNLGYGIGARTVFPWFGYDTDGNTQLLSDKTNSKLRMECSKCDREDHSCKDLHPISRPEAVAIVAGL